MQASNGADARANIHMQPRLSLQTMSLFQTILGVFSGCPSSRLYGQAAVLRWQQQQQSSSVLLNEDEKGFESKQSVAAHHTSLCWPASLL